MSKDLMLALLVVTFILNIICLVVNARRDR